MKLVTSALVIVAIFHGAEAGLRQRGPAKARSASFQASSFAGATTSAVFPPPGATNTGSDVDSLFPDESEVGFAGPTPSESFITVNDSLILIAKFENTVSW